MTEARKISQKQHKHQGKLLQNRTGTTKIPVVLERPLTDFLKVTCKNKPFSLIVQSPACTDLTSVLHISFSLVESIFLTRNGTVCSKVVFQNTVFYFRHHSLALTRRQTSHFSYCQIASATCIILIVLVSSSQATHLTRFRRKNNDPC